MLALFALAAAAMMLMADAFSVQGPPAASSRRSGPFPRRFLSPKNNNIRLFQAADDWSSSASPKGAGSGRIEQIEYKIYPDGRVEETVRGVKGSDCHKVPYYDMHVQLARCVSDHNIMTVRYLTLSSSSLARTN